MKRIFWALFFLSTLSINISAMEGESEQLPEPSFDHNTEEHLKELDTQQAEIHAREAEHNTAIADHKAAQERTQVSNAHDNIIALHARDVLDLRQKARQEHDPLKKAHYEKRA